MAECPSLQWLRELDEARLELLEVYARNPELLARAEPRIRALMLPLPEPPRPGAGGGEDGAQKSPQAAGAACGRRDGPG